MVYVENVGLQFMEKLNDNFKKFSMNRYQDFDNFDTENYTMHIDIEEAMKQYEF